MINDANIGERKDPPQPYDQSCEEGIQIAEEQVLIEVYFEEGSLGVTLRRRGDTGIVFVYEILPGSQAVNLDVQSGDELWGVGDTEIGNTPLDKDAWNGLIQFIKNSSRPLRVIFKRLVGVEIPLPLQQELPVQANVDETNQTVIEVLDNDVSNPMKNETSLNNGELAAPAIISVKDSQSQAYLDLRNLLSKFIPKDSITNKLPSLGHLSKKVSSATAADSDLLQEGRVILKVGELVEKNQKAGRWHFNLQQSRRFIALLSGVLIVSIPVGPEKYQIEHIINLQTCKLRSNGQLFGGDGSNAIEQQSDMNPSFEIIWPGGTLEMHVDSTESKEIWMLNIYLAICECVGPNERSLGWRHQYMLGTMHSAVLNRDIGLIRELATQCVEGKLSFMVVDALDEDGYSPLHYACILRMQSIVAALHEATADVTVVDRRGLTPLHWTAMQLDADSLSLICTQIFNVDLVDSIGRTPLYVACVEGRDVSGKTDAILLKRCIETLLKLNPEVNAVDAKGNTLLHYLSASWFHEAVEMLVHAGAEIHTAEVSSGMTALHYAADAWSLKSSIGEGERIISSTAKNQQEKDDTEVSPEDLNRPHGGATLKTLLWAGSMPNLKDANGRTPLHVLAESDASSLYLADSPDTGDDDDNDDDDDDIRTSFEMNSLARWGTLKEVREAIAVMISHGCRLDDSPIFLALKSRHPDINFAALTETWLSSPVINADSLGIQLNHFGKSGSEKVSSPTYSSSVLAANTACLLCGFQFTLFRRQHHCRICSSLCCDDCSKKRCIVDNAQVRTCDSCYNRLLYKQEMTKRQAVIDAMQAQYRHGPQSQSLQPSLTGHAQSMQQQQQAKKDLFGVSASPPAPQDARSSTQRPGAGVAGTMSTMNEVQLKLQERGEKLSKLSDRTAEMANQAQDFARLAKQLNEQQKSRWF